MATYEDTDGNEVTRDELIELLTEDYIDSDENDYFSREEQQEYATYIVDHSEDGVVW